MASQGDGQDMRVLWICINNLTALAAATQGTRSCMVMNKAAPDGMQSGSRHAHKHYTAQLAHIGIRIPVKQKVASVYLVRYGHTEAFVVRAAEGVQKLAQVVD